MREHPYVQLPATLQGVPFLSELDQDSLETVLRSSRLYEYDPGEAVLDEGRAGSAFYVLLRGAVNVVKDGAKIAEISGRGETIGELNLFSGAAREASVVAADKVFCLRVDRAALDALDGERRLAYEAALYRFLAEILIERLKATNERLAAAEAALSGKETG